MPNRERDHRRFAITMAACGRMTQALRKSHAMGPTVRNLLNQYKLDPNQISSTGPHQTLLKSDVLSYLNSRKPGTEVRAETKDDVPPPWGLSAPKPSTNRSNRYQVNNFSKTRYARRTLSELEIEVINMGGSMPDPKQDSSKQKRR